MLVYKSADISDADLLITRDREQETGVGSLSDCVGFLFQLCARALNGIPQCRCRWQMKALRDYCSGRRIGGRA